jgi:glycosyltransferase involved in cell wall biosynthesis
MNNAFEFHFFFGKNQEMGIQSIDFTQDPFPTYQERLHSLKNSWVKGKFLVWQNGVISKCLLTKPDLVILLGEALIFSNWIGALICRMRGIRVVFLGHGMYGNEPFFKLLFRKSFCKLANEHIVYERRAKKILQANGLKGKKIHVLFNSLDYDTHLKLRESLGHLDKKEIFPFLKNPADPTLIFIGRLTTSKKLDMLLRAVKALYLEGIKLNILMVGDGTERAMLEHYATDNLETGSFHFFGACYDEVIAGKLIAAADLCVSPGNVGLTAVHSLSFGTPLCTHNNWGNQGPEVEALEEGRTGIFFEENNLDDLILKLKEWSMNIPANREDLRRFCYTIIDTYYNPYYQEKVIQNVVEGHDPFI